MPRKISELELKRGLASENMLTFTRLVFKELNNQEFVRSDHHREICRALEDVYNGKCKRLIINIPPRHSKTELAVINFIAWCYGKNPACRFMHLSYSNELVIRNSRSIQETMRTQTFKSLFTETEFPDSRIKSNHWKTTVGGEFYAASTGGQITGFGAGVVDAVDDTEEVVDSKLMQFEADNSSRFMGAIIIDDPIKPDDGLSKTIREKVNQRFENTIRSRANSINTPIIVIMQRVHEHDLCGYLMETEKEQWRVLSLPAITQDEKGNDKALWSAKLPMEALERLRRANSYVFETQYMQNPKPLEGLMYERFKTYDVIPIESKMKPKNYTDTADTGADYLCSICYIETPTACYVTDILYTKKPMEFTEVETAKMLIRNKTEEVNIESNNGGRGFKRNVEKNVRLLGDTRMVINDFTQSKNKNSRIFTKSADVQNMVYFPLNWKTSFYEYARDMTNYRKEAKNTHDDAPDATTGIIDKFNNYKPISDEEIANAFY